MREVIYLNKLGEVSTCVLNSCVRQSEKYFCLANNTIHMRSVGKTMQHALKLFQES